MWCLSLVSCCCFCFLWANVCVFYFLGGRVETRGGFSGFVVLVPRIRFAVYTEMQEFEIHLPGLDTCPEILIRNLK